MAFAVETQRERDSQAVDEVEASPDEALEAAIVRAEEAFRRLERRVNVAPADRRRLLH